MSVPADVRQTLTVSIALMRDAALNAQLAPTEHHRREAALQALERAEAWLASHEIILAADLEGLCSSN